jgi:2-polyprenyl-6-methoxyphenol hydroxylase-like FAD-dependent oxidoreductase
VATDFLFRKSAVGQLTTQVGVYILCDLDEIPLYVGQSRDGIRSRVRRHLTSARSDIIANRQIDIWEVAFVWTFPVTNVDEIGPLEALLYHHFNPLSQLINGSVPPIPVDLTVVPDPAQKVQVMKSEEIASRKESPHRLPRQASHYAEIVSHFLEVKQSKQIAKAMSAHFERLARYHQELLGIAATAESEVTDD